MNNRLKVNRLHSLVNLHTVANDGSYGGYRRVIRWLTTLHTGSYDTVTVIFSKVFNDLLGYFKPLTEVEGGIVQILSRSFANKSNSLHCDSNVLLKSLSTILYAYTLQFELYTILSSILYTLYENSSTILYSKSILLNFYSIRSRSILG